MNSMRTRTASAGGGRLRRAGGAACRALGRPPALTETAALGRHLDNATDKRAALEDITWAIVNSKEFVMRH